MKQLNIALLSIHSCPWAKPGNRYTGGMNIYIQNQAREMAERGHLVDIFTTSHPGENQCSQIKLTNGIRLIHINAADYTLISENNLESHVNDVADAILSYCQKLNLPYELIHSHYWLSGLIGNILSKSWNIPHITMFHTLAALKNRAGLGGLEPSYRIDYEKSVIAECNLIIASTQQEKSDLVIGYGANPDKVTVIPCGINPSLFKPIDKEIARKACGLDANINTMLFVGRMDPLKGLPNLLEALALLRHRDNFRLLVIGGENDKEAGFRNMLDIILTYQLSPVVIPLGSVPHEDMYLYYNAADFCIIPSYYESFCLVALESLACGTPVLSTDVGEVKEMVQGYPSCRIITGATPSALAEHIEDMLSKITTGKSGDINTLVRRYGWDSVIEKILRQYERILLIGPLPEPEKLSA